jgi:uncharacterized protein (TIGR00369 family)
MTPRDGPEAGPFDPRRYIGDYFRIERWEIPPPPGEERPSDIGGRMPVDAHQRGAGGGLVTGGLLTGIDTLGGLLSGLSVLPKWIVTTNMMVTVVHLDHRGPLRLHGRVLRRGRNAVVTALDIVDEGDSDREVAAATMTSAVLEPKEMEISFDPGTGPVTRLDLVERLRNPWGILHGGALAMLADVATCRAVEALPGNAGGGTGAVAAGDTVLHYLSPARVGPIEARCQVLGGRSGRTLVRVAMHDLGAGDRMVSMGSVAVVDV